METLAKFKAMGLSDVILKALKKKGFEEPSQIQEKTIPLLLEAKQDLIGQAQTGTGKTAAFGLPILEKLEPSKDKKVQALILAPTRELAIQVAEELNSLKGTKKLKILPVYGGQSIGGQISNLKRGVDIVVGTPGRIIDHIGRKTLKLDCLKYMILDEADEMLNMGFIDDVEEILKETPEERTMLLFSATMPAAIKKISKKYMKNQKIITIENKQLTVDLTDQIYFEVSRGNKFEALCRIVDIELGFYGIVFCKTKVQVDEVSNHLNERGYAADAIHGDISQNQRERVLAKFKRKKTTILVATDVAARGIDVNDLTHVINYSLPQDPESYVHRIGRTGRAGKEGTAITFITSSEYRKLSFIQKRAKTEIRKETLPNAADIITSKKSKIKEEIFKILSSGDFTTYTKLAEELLESNDAKLILASALKFTLQEQLDENNYKKISQSSRNSSKDIKMIQSGTTRLFIAKGKKDNINTATQLIEFIQEKVDVNARKINDIKVLENFSFMTVPFKEAEDVIDAFKRGRGGRPVVEEAKGKK